MTMASEFPPPQAELLETFEELDDWEDRYEFILDIGRELPAMDSQIKTEANKVHGCMSTVWLALEGVENDDSDGPTINIVADSDSMIVKGLIVVLLSLYNGKTPQQAINEDPQDFFKRLGLNQHLSPNRRNGLFSMVGRVRELCVELAAQS